MLENNVWKTVKESTKIGQDRKLYAGTGLCSQPRFRHSNHLECLNRLLYEYNTYYENFIFIGNFNTSVEESNGTF